VRSYRTVSPLPITRWAVCFLWHCPASHLDWPLASTLPYEARTFLSWRSLAKRHQRPPRPLRRASASYLQPARGGVKQFRMRYALARRLVRMLKIWGRMSSINVRKVVFAAQELAVPFERVDAGGSFGVVQTPAYRAKNPNALVPFVEDDQVELWESNVIVRYLCARHAPDTLYPLGLAQRFDAERWMDWQQTTLNPAGRPGFIQWIRTPAERRDPQVIAQSVGDRAAAGAARRPPRAPAVHRRRAAHDGRSADRLRGPSLDRPAAATHRAAPPRPLVRVDPGPAVDPRRPRSAAGLTRRDHRGAGGVARATDEDEDAVRNTRRRCAG